MKFNDQGFVINSKDYGEKSAVVKILSEEHGICRAFIRQAQSPKTKNILQIGNLISFTYSTRLEENLGNFSHLDIVQSNSAYFMFDKLKLDCVQSIFSIIDDLFLEYDSSPELFNYLNDFLLFLSNNSHKSSAIIAKYIKLELLILQILGYGLDFSSCVVTNSTVNLSYISPKSGRAVSLDAGQKYHHKLLKLPKFILDENAQYANEQLYDGLKLSGYFLEKIFVSTYANKKLFYRDNIVKAITKAKA
ncbi:MAG: DNA repair protein RecO [Alphaproteobacteria bacterium]